MQQWVICFFCFTMLWGQTMSAQTRLAVFLESSPNHAQIDSFLRVIPASTGSSKVPLFLELAGHFKGKQDFVQVKLYLERAYDWAKLQGNEEQLSSLELQIAEINLKLGNWDEALDLAIRSHSVSQTINNDSLFFEANTIIGQVYLLQGKTDFARGFIQDAFEFAVSKNEQYYLAKAYWLQGWYAWKTQDGRKAENFLKSGLNISTEVNLRFIEAQVRLVLSRMYFSDKREQDASRQLEMAFQSISLSSDKSLHITILEEMALQAISMGNTTKATDLREQAFIAIEETENNPQKQRLLEGLIGDYVASGNTEKAKIYFEQYSALKERGYLSQEQYLQIKANFDRRIDDQQSIIKDYKDRVSSKTTQLWLTGFLSLLIIVFLTFLFYNAKKARALLRNKKEVLEQKRELSLKELKQTKQELLDRTSSLQEITQILMEKNAHIRTLMVQMEEIKNSKEFTLVAKEDVQLVNELLSLKILTDDDWERFRKVYNQVYEGLEAKLKIKHPNLSKSEKKLFMVAKLNLSMDESGALLAISPESVRKARYRLKKKLDLQDRDLQEYINSF